MVDTKDIERIVRSTIISYACNSYGEADPKKLPDAIAKAVAKAISLYDSGK